LGISRKITTTTSCWQPSCCFLWMPRITP
jgi:hypothetical protein